MTPAALYFFIAILGTLAYGIGCFVIFGDVAMPPSQRMHQHWFNLAGAAVGWIAGWPVFFQWFILGVPPTFVTIALLAIAFIGVTGHLPLTTMTLLQRKQPNGHNWPSERP
jgi:hypothetical protein